MVPRFEGFNRKEYLSSKLWPGIFPMFVIGELLAVSSSAILRAEPTLNGYRGELNGANKKTSARIAH